MIANSTVHIDGKAYDLTIRKFTQNPFGNSPWVKERLMADKSIVVVANKIEPLPVVTEAEVGAYQPRYAEFNVVDGFIYFVAGNDGVAMKLAFEEAEARAQTTRVGVLQAQASKH